MPVYLIQAGRDGPVKIGRGRDPLRRLATLQSASPEHLRLIGVVSGGAVAERTLHDRFRSSRIRGEWFRLNAEMLHLVRELRDDDIEEAARPRLKDPQWQFIERAGRELGADPLLHKWRSRGVPWKYRLPLTDIAKREGFILDRGAFDRPARLELG